MYGWPWERGGPAAGRHKSCRGVSGPAEVRQRQKMKVFREAMKEIRADMKASEARHQQEMKASEAKYQQEMKEFREAMKVSEARHQQEMKANEAKYQQEMKEMRADRKALNESRVPVERPWPLQGDG